MENRVKWQAINENPAIADPHSALFSQVASLMPSGCRRNELAVRT